MIIKGPRTKSKERKKKELESNYYSKSPEEDKPRTSASFLRIASKSTRRASTIITSTHTRTAILEMPIMISTKASVINTNKMVST